MPQALEDSRPRRLQPVAGRVPPHNIEAEESVLGAMLLSRDAIASALECCSAEDFYKPAHSHVFAAITSLYTRGEPADPVTVADELRRSGAIEAIGDPSLLVSLQVNTPSTANAGHYARIVEEHALLRRLVAVAGEIAELGYSVPGDVAEVVDRAETLVFEVAQRRVVDTLSPLRDLLAASLDHLEHLYEREETITGVPTGYVDLDERLSGLQPSNLVVVGARPAMGKALALDTPVATPDGWSTMGALQPGDRVYDETGQPCTVTYASPVFVGHRCYRLRFDDGAELVADAGHRWLAWDRPGWEACRERRWAVASGRPEPPPGRPWPGPAAGGQWPDGTGAPWRPRLVTTEQMVVEGVRCDDGRPNWHVALAGPIDGAETDVPVDPYVLGCWLGGGGRQGELAFEPGDAACFVAELEDRGYWLARRGERRWAALPIAHSAGPVEGGDGGRWRDLGAELATAGLTGGRAVTALPPAYLRGSAKQRLALLQGLMDTAGVVGDDGRTVELRLADRALLAQAWEVVCSLGQKPYPIGPVAGCRPDGPGGATWRFRWRPTDPVFRLGRKAERLAVPAGDGPPGGHTRRALVAVDEVPTTPVRCIAVDSPSHLFLAGWAMVPTHNTSFALGIVNHAAVTTRKSVLLFSLEMSHLELTQRMLCSEARVDATRMRNGRLLDSDWPKISDAIGRLGDAPIFIDDNPNVTVMDIRAKARRLMAREGLGLVVVDYLQLMTGRSRAESRQVEVSEISRGLKILARELNVPVLALSQLSRNLEMRQDKRPVLADLRESGCLTADTRVTRADTGAEVTLGELLVRGERAIPVWALDEQLRWVPATMTHVFPSGVKRIYELRLASGRRVQASANHPFRTVQGWRRLDELAPGDRLATAGSLPTPVGTRPRPGAEVVAPARLRDGTVTHRPLHATGADPAPGAPGSGVAVLDDDHRRPLAGSEVFWDEIVAVEDSGEAPVYDATVLGHHNFLANGIVAHNSIEQDADVVLFIYRDEVYNPDSEERGSAEIIIAKHRNGPVGNVQLAFVDHYTRFANMARM